MQQTFDRLDDLLSIAGRTAERFIRVSGRFSDRVDEVPAAAWSDPALPRRTHRASRAAKRRSNGEHRVQRPPH